MKKLTSRTVLLVALTVASLGSYLYLNSLSSEELRAVQPIKIEQEAASPVDRSDIEHEEVRLPGVTLVKTVFEFGKRLVYNY